MMNELLLRWFGPRTLDGIRKPSRARFAATIKTPNEIQSPLTDRTAALFRWAFFVRFQEVELAPAGPRVGGSATILKSTGNTLEMTQLLAVELLWDGLVLQRPEADLALLPVAVDLRFGRALDDLRPLDRRVPAPLQATVESSMSRKGQLMFRETALSYGDQVTITATIVPVPRASTSVYRGNGGALYHADPALGPIILQA